MTDLPAIIAAEREDYWRVVAECLNEFYGMNPDECIRQVNRAREYIKDHTEEELELYYHAEPLSIANHLARSPFDFPDEWIDRYLEIRDGAAGVSEQSRVGDGFKMGMAG